ncbi:MAG: transketolase, partial [Candidatus Brocadiales bacterium]|nr:transketolase [Candidatus Bathyanammoxibius sp.]
MSRPSIEVLEEKARQVRRHIIRTLAKAGSGHPGGSLSATDLMVALYHGKLKHDPKNPDWPDRDRFVLSKGHSCPALYAVL